MSKKMTPEEALETIESLKKSEKITKSDTFKKRFLIYLVTVAFLAVVNRLTSPSYRWVIWPALGMGLGLIVSYLKGKYD